MIAGSPFNALARSIVNLDKRIRKIETVPNSALPFHPVTPGAGWTPVAGHAALAYWKDSGSIVHFQGTVAGVAPALLFTLPVNYRPAGQLVFGTPVGATITVQTTGAVTVTAAAGNVSVDGITFKAVQ